MSSVMVAIPALNEEQTIAAVIAGARKALPDATVVVIDDGSCDATVAVARDAGAVVLSLPFNVGVGGAIRTAFVYARDAGHDIVLQLDADGQHDVTNASAVVEAARTSSVVVGSRFLAGQAYPMGRVRRLTMRMMARLVSAAVATRLTDTTSGFRASDRAAIELFAREYPAEYLGDTVESLVIAHRAGLSIHEVAVRMFPRQAGVPSQDGLRSVLYLLRAVLAVGVGLLRPRRQVAG